MPSLDLETMRRALALARTRGLARLDLTVGGATLAATLSPDWEPTEPVVTADESGEPVVKTVFANAPVVGYFRPAAMIEGDEISEGQSIGDVVALGISNEVGSPTDGVFDGFLASDGDPVEYGQQLVRIVAK
ncbi:MAG: hypothetical protein JSS65_01625 [Armatimonadetes bacterium]|nr:hypothetical protein [Armatimonadota bacterium]